MLFCCFFDSFCCIFSMRNVYSIISNIEDYFLYRFSPLNNSALVYTQRNICTPLFTLKGTSLRNIVQTPVTCALRPCTLGKYSRPWALLRLTALFFNLTDWNYNLAIEDDKLALTDRHLLVNKKNKPLKLWSVQSRRNRTA